MSVLKKLAGQTAVYGLSTIIGRFLNYLLVPLHLKIFAPQEYGIVTDIYAYIAFLNVIFTYGMETAYFRFATKVGGSSTKAYNTAISSILLTSLVLAGFIFFNAQTIATLLGYGDKGRVIEWVAIILATDAVVAIPFAKLRLLNRVYLFAGAKISNILSNIFLNLFFLLLCPMIMNDGLLPSLYPLVSAFYNPKWGIDYIFAANVLSNLAYLPFLIPSLRGLRLTVDLSYWREMLIYGFPILIMGIAGSFNDMFSRIMLKQLLPEGYYPGRTSLAALGIFGACYKLSVFMILAIQAFRYASEPFFFSKAQDKNAPEVFARVMNFFVITTTLIFLFVSINIEWLSLIFNINNEYKEGLIIVPILLMANLFMGIYFNLSIWYKLSDKTYWGTYITIAGALITITLNYLLVPYMGYLGSAWATFACYFTMSVGSYLIGQNNYPVPYHLGKIAGYLLTGVILFGISLYIHHEGAYGFLIQNSLVLVYLIIIIVAENISLKKRAE